MTFNTLRKLGGKFFRTIDGLPITKISEKPVMPVNVMLRLLGAIEDLGDLCLMLVATFSGPRASEAMGFLGRAPH